jgi:polyphosphate kinase 2 PPK2
MDVEARVRWEQYTKAKEAMLERTHIPEAPWHVVHAVEEEGATELHRPPARADSLQRDPLQSGSPAGARP